ncbi:MAG: hypothetical protein ACFE0Q_01785 [Anaerolineae bacterium]
MKVIVLTGLVSIEKGQLAHQLAGHFSASERVVLLNNSMAQLSAPAERQIPVHALPDLASLVPTLHTLADQTDCVIVALSEQAHPEQLFVALDDLREQHDDWQVYSLALIDTRTCDCFPHVREALELYADASIMMPYQLSEVVAYVDG